MKKPKQKHYFATIKEQQGEYEHETRYLFKTAGDPNAYNEKVARTWYGDDAEDCEYSGGYVSGDIIVSAGEVKKIPASDFATLKKYLSVL